ncbi:MAG: phosphate ABC transporter permease subunit PstC [Myxococcota bacterium]
MSETLHVSSSTGGVSADAFRRSHAAGDAIARIGLRGVAVATSAIACLILLYLLIESFDALRDLGPSRFLGDSAWRPTSGEFNLVPMLVGTFVVTMGAVFVSTPFALASAIFGRFFLEGLPARLFRRFLETLSGIPSVLFGLWGLNVVVPWIAAWAPPGQSVLAGIVVLSMMILPTVALLADTALLAVPEAQLRAGAAAGLSRWAIVRSIALPGARSGVGVAVLLGAGRALGETMAVVMVMGNVPLVPAHVFAPARTLTANIALEMAYAGTEHRSTLFVSGLMLALLAMFGVWVSGRIENAERAAERGRYGV